MTLSETSNDLDDERKMDLMDLDFCSFLDGECNDKLEGDGSGFSNSRRDRPTVWRDNNNHLEYSLMTNYEDNGAGIEMDGKPAPNATFGSGGSISTTRSDQQGLKSMNGFGELSENKSGKDSTQQSEQMVTSNGPLQFSKNINNNNNLDGTSNGHLSRPEISAQLHPQAIQSSAACPPHDALNIAQAAFNSLASAWGASPFMFNTAVESGQLAGLKDGSTHSYFSNEKTIPLVNSNTSGELYANFLASQKPPPRNDSFSYEIPMSGFASNQDNGRSSGAVNCTSNCTSGNKGVKNAKEQKRAKQITNLIEQLRITMEKDGWKIEVNSKFHTLSSCARYLKHMKNANELKERAIQEVKNQLEAKRLRVEDESAQQDRSEPESTFSDLTDSSMSAKVYGKADTGTGSDCRDDDDKVSNPKRKTQRLMVSQQSTLSSSGSSGAENEAKTTVTDSAMSSSSCKNTNSSGENLLGGPNGSITSSNAATESVKLDFKEVFIKSNIPQLLATDSGKIVTWNAFFLEITGLEPKELQSLTIFSLVPSRELAKLFEFVAKALRESSLPCTQERNSKEFSETSSITLPCVPFPREANDENMSRPLSMTVTMMSNADPRKRWFHVVFSDQSGSNGAMGSIPPDLLGLLFAGPLESNPLYPNSMRKVHKKRKQPA